MPSPAIAKSSKLKLVDGLDKALARPGNRPSLLLRPALLFIIAIFITTIPGCTIQQHLAAQEVARKAPPPADNPALPDLPFAVPFQPDDNSLPLTLEADTQSRHGDIYRLEGSVVIVYRGHTIRADRISFDASTNDVIAEGHVLLTGGDNDESMQASHGVYNLDTQKGTFYDVTGSVGMGNAARRTGYSTQNPFLFSGRMVVKTGPTSYDIYDGNVTSCLLPNPDWLLSSQHFSMGNGQARAYKSTFRLLRVPILFLPYVTHPLDSQARQSGILIPVISQSNSKGLIFGEEGYIVMGRSADLTVGLQYFTLRGFSESSTFRYHGVDSDFLTAHFSALQDRGFTPAGGTFTDQGGEDITAAFRRKLTSKTRVVGDAEYLSSYVYREAFNDSFNQAISSDITSVLYAVNQQYGFSTDIRADRYLGLKRVPITTLNRATGLTVSQPGQQITIFHAPSIDFTAVDHRIPGTPFLWSLDSSATGLKRAQPNFTSSGMIERFDFRPELSLPLSGGGWHTLSSIAVRDTFYSRSRVASNSQPPVELTQPINRTSVEMSVDIRPPAIERDFHPPAFIASLLGPELRHTIEPEIVYRDTRGIDNFLGVLRFDDIDVDSNTNEVEYGVTQRLFARRISVKSPKPCAAAPVVAHAIATPGASTKPVPPPEPEDEPDTDAPSGLDANGIPTPDAPPEPNHSHAHNASKCPLAEPQQHEWISWKLAQKRFLDPTFGGAIVNTRRNILDTTLNFSGIAFLTEARDISPLISRMRIRTSSHTDVEWDFDLDTGAKKFTSNNIFIDAHEGPLFGGISYARLNAPGRFFTETIDNNGVGSLTSSAVSDFSQMRLLMGYGNSSKPGLSLAANANLDLNLGSVQYLSAQTGYNWNCCGLSIEYRKYELGSVRNEGTYKFNFTLANIGTAGNLRKAERLF
jgi:LPS-assembly protein